MEKTYGELSREVFKVC